MSPTADPRRITGLRGLVSSHRAWTWGAIVLAAFVIALIALLVLRHQEAMELVTRRVESVQQARIDLAKGFLHVSLAGDPSAPSDPVEGAALVQQALAAFDSALTVLEPAGGEATAAFRRSAGAFGDRLAEWQAATAPDAGLAVRLRVAYSDVEREAVRLETLVQRQPLELDARLGAELGIALAAAMLLLVVGSVVELGMQRAVARSRATLAESQERLSFALEGTNDGLWDVQLPSGSVYLSPRGCEILGFRPDELPRIAATWDQLVHPDDLPATRAALDAYLDGRAPIFEVEQRLRAASGEWKWVAARGKAVGRDASGAPTRMVGTHTDISARKRGEEALRVNEERLRLAVDAVELGIYDLNVQTGESTVNAQYARTLGYDPVGFDLSTAAWIERLHPDERDAVVATYRDFFAGKLPECRVEFRQRTRSGDWKWIASLTRAVERDAQGAPLRIVGMHTDISEGKQAEEQLRAAAKEAARLLEKEVRSRRVLLSIVEDQRVTEAALRDKEQLLAESQRISHLGSWAIELPGFETSWSQEAYQVFGVSPRTFVLSFESFLSLIHPDDVAAMQEWTRACQAGEEPAALEFRTMRSDGSVRILEGQGSLARDGENRAVRMFGTVRDITDRKRAEAEIRELNEELEQRVQERTAELEAANKELEAFGYSVSHDLRAPLRAISGFASILARRYRDGLDEKGRHYVDTIVDSSDHMGVLIDELLGYSRMGRGVVRAEPVPLDPLVNQLRSTFALRIAAAGAEFEVVEPLATPVGDPLLLERLLANLVDNALTYRRPDVAPRVTLSATRGSNTVTLAVADNGIGIPPEYHERVFEVFARLHADDEYPGTGIGLSIVRKAARLMGSEVTVESTEGVGSTFSLELPAARKRSTQP